MPDHVGALGARWQSETCPQCGFAPQGVEPERLPHAVVAVVDRLAARVADKPRGVATRPDADVWSALAYACHVRDVLSVFAERIDRMLAEDNPELGWWDHEASVDDEGYELQDPTVVADQLRANARLMAATLSAVPEEGWQRVGTRRGGAEPFTVLGAGRFALHEATHHAADVEDVLGRV